MLAALARHHIADYSIHYYPPLHLLIAHFKYTGDDFDADMKMMAEDEETRRWWAITDKMQESFVEGAEGSGGELPWWLVSIEVTRDTRTAVLIAHTGSRGSVPVRGGRRECTFISVISTSCERRCLGPETAKVYINSPIEYNVSTCDHSNEISGDCQGNMRVEATSECRKDGNTHRSSCLEC